MHVLADKCSTLGDGVCFLPALAALAESPRITRITLVTSPITQPVFEDLSPKIDRIVLDRRNTEGARALRGIAAAYPALRHTRFDAAIHTPYTQSLFFVLARILRIPVRIGYDALARGRNFANRRLPLDPLRNMVDLNLGPVRELLGNPALAPRRTPPRIRPADADAAARRLADAGIAPGASFVLLHRGARNAYRQWPHFDELADAVRRSLGVPVVEVSAETSPAPHALCGLSFSEFAAVTSRAAACVCNNSGPMHLAGALGIPTVVLQGATAFAWEFYWADVPHRTLRVAGLACAPCERIGYNPPDCANREHPMACMTGIDVERVVAALAELLATRRCP